MLFFFCNIDSVLTFFITFVLFSLSKMSEDKLIFSMYLQKLESIFKSSIFYFLEDYHKKKTSFQLNNVATNNNKITHL